MKALYRVSISRGSQACTVLYNRIRAINDRVIMRLQCIGRVPSRSNISIFLKDHMVFVNVGALSRQLTMIFLRNRPTLFF